MFTGSLSRWEPFRELSTQNDRMTRLFRELYSPEGPQETLTTSTFSHRQWTFTKMSTILF
jgi:hypothetical protein